MSSLSLGEHKHRWLSKVGSWNRLLGGAFLALPYSPARQDRLNMPLPLWTLLHIWGIISGQVLF